MREIRLGRPGWALGWPLLTMVSVLICVPCGAGFLVTPLAVLLDSPLAHLLCALVQVGGMMVGPMAAIVLVVLSARVQHQHRIAFFERLGLKQEPSRNRVSFFKGFLGGHEVWVALYWRRYGRLQFATLELELVTPVSRLWKLISWNRRPPGDFEFEGPDEASARALLQDPACGPLLDTLLRCPDRTVRALRTSHRGLVLTWSEVWGSQTSWDRLSEADFRRWFEQLRSLVAAAPPSTLHAEREGAPPAG